MLGKWKEIEKDWFYGNDKYNIHFDVKDIQKIFN